MSAVDELIRLARSLTPSGEIGDGMVARFHELADRADAERASLRRLFEANPDHVAPDGMRRSIHRSHRGEGFNHGVGE